MPKVSVVVTTYNRKELLRETIQSILDQTFRDFELIVVDNYSNYDFFEYIKSFNDYRIRAFQNQNNGIIAVNRNFGIKKAKGEYIAFCDDDDLWTKKKLETQLKKLVESKADLVSSNMFIFKGNRNNVQSKTKNRKPKGIKDLLSYNQIYTSTVLVKNVNALFFPEDISLITVEDYGLWIKLLNVGYNFEFIDEALVYYRKMPEGSYVKNYKNRNLKLINFYVSLLISSKFLKQKNRIILLMAIQMAKYVSKNILSYILGKRP